MDSRSETGSEELLSVSHYTGVTLKRESLENEDDHLTNAESLVGYKLVAKNDLVINIMLAWNGSLGISPYNGITSPAYCVYRIKDNNNPEYFGYLFSTNLFKAEFRRHSTGIIVSRLRLYSDKFFSIFSVVPPKDEQDEIVQYIKAQEEKINRFIEKKQRFIELLKEQRQNIITHAITKGINPNAKMKVSKFDWFGEVPAHWEVGRAKNYSKIFVPERNKPELNEYNQGFPWITCEFMKSDNLLEDKIRFHVSETSMSEAGIRSLPKYSVIAPCVGSFDMAVIVPFECVINQQLQAYIPNRIDAVYLQYTILISNSFFESNATLTTLKYVDKDKFSCLPVLYPPLEEQKQIVEHIKTETATIDTAIAKAEREIELIREYKEAMIGEAVMGKMKKIRIN
jgi:type I restriction enzyme S subunit